MCILSMTVLILKFSNLIKIRSPHFCKPPNAPSSQVCFQMVVVSDKNTHVILKYLFHRILIYICSEWQHTHTHTKMLRTIQLLFTFNLGSIRFLISGKYYFFHFPTWSYRYVKTMSCDSGHLRFSINIKKHIL